MSQRNRLAIAAVACLAVASVAGAWWLSSRSAAAGSATELLPDLDQVVPGKLTGSTSGKGARRRFLLGFSSAVENVGSGQLLVTGKRSSRKDATMRAEQTVLRSDGSRLVLRVRGAVIRYVRSATHQHWHYLRFDRYELRDGATGKLVRPDRKTGFCLGDRYYAGRHLPLEPGQPEYVGECGKNHPELLRVEEGISVGYGDDYKPNLEGQRFDITRLRAGRYLLVHRANADRALRESDYGNNDASLLLQLAWPRGFRFPPRIDVLERCADSAHCTE